MSVRPGTMKRRLRGVERDSRRSHLVDKDHHHSSNSMRSSSSPITASSGSTSSRRACPKRPFQPAATLARGQIEDLSTVLLKDGAAHCSEVSGGSGLRAGRRFTRPGLGRQGKALKVVGGLTLSVHQILPILVGELPELASVEGAEVLPPCARRSRPAGPERF